MRKLINDKKKNGEWNIQLIMKINFISSRNFTESRDIYSQSDNFEITMGGNTNEIIRNLFNSILRRYQGGLHESMNDDDKYFQYAITITLNYDEIGNHHQGVNKVKPFIDQYNWKDINFPSHVDDWKKFELNNKSVALNVLYNPEVKKL